MRFEESPPPTAHRFSHSPAILATCQFHLCFTACPQHLIKIKADLCHYNIHNRKHTQRPSVSTATLRGAGAGGWRSKKALESQGRQSEHFLFLQHLHANDTYFNIAIKFISSHLHTRATQQSNLTANVFTLRTM